jgi:hypothetical protein
MQSFSPPMNVSDAQAPDAVDATAATRAFTEPLPRPDDPLDPAIHMDAFVRHMGEGRTDAAFLAALALEELGSIEGHHQALLRQFRSIAPVRARGTLDAAAWDLLRVPSPHEALARFFRVVAPSAVAARLDQLVDRRRLVPLDPAGRLDETSTASVVRSFQWSARVLGAVCPALYVVDEVPGEIAAVRAREASTAVGPSVVSGRSAKDLAFLAGRHLTYYLPEHQVVVYYPTHEELSQLVLAAKCLVSTREAARAVVGLSVRLDRYVGQAERTLLVATMSQLATGVGLDVNAWARGIELTAARAGLFLCGDLATVMALVRRESRAIAGLSFEEKRADLIAFCASAAHASLRERFVVTDAQSVPPSEPPRSDERPGMPPQWRSHGVLDAARRSAT